MVAKNHDRRMPVESDDPTREFDERREAEAGADESAANLATAVAEMRRELRKSLAWSQIIHEQNKRIQRRLTLMTLGNYIRLLLILSPFILAAIYLPPIIRRAVEFYDNLMVATTNTVPVHSLGNIIQWLQSATSTSPNL